jgi:hypothetical protein
MLVRPTPAEPAKSQPGCADTSNQCSIAPKLDGAI